MTRQPTPREGAATKDVVVTTWRDERVPVILHPSRYGGGSRTEWEVYLPNEDLTSRWIGTLARYTGTLDRPISKGSRIRRQGKSRTLWGSQSAEGRWWGSRVSRADALRHLLQEAGVEA